MTCSQCGEPCQGQYCKTCSRALSRDGDWQNRLEDAGDLPDEDPLAFLGPDVHYCDPCDRPFGSLKALANHECVIQGPDDPRLDAVDGAVATTVRGPTPRAQERWDAEHAQSGGDST